MNIFWLIQNSITLDYKFIRISDWSIDKKINFLIKKYYLIIKHCIKKFELGKSQIIFFGQKIFYDSKFGIAGYQSLLARHQKMIKIADIKNATNVIDVGANVGFFSMLARNLYPQCNIYSVEPIPQTYKCLKQNFITDKKTKTFNTAITDVPGIVSMKFNSSDSAISQIDNNGSIKISATTMDNFVAEQSIASIDILKIDVETFEAHCLRKASEALKLTKYLFIEITIENNSNYTISSLFKLLSSEDYDFQLVAFRNYDDTGEGKMPIMDVLLKNIKHK